MTIVAVLCGMVFGAIIGALSLAIYLGGNQSEPIERHRLSRQAPAFTRERTNEPAECDGCGELIFPGQDWTVYSDGSCRCRMCVYRLAREIGTRKETKP